MAKLQVERTVLAVEKLQVVEMVLELAMLKRSRGKRREQTKFSADRKKKVDF